MSYCHCKNCRRPCGNFVAAARTETYVIAMADRPAVTVIIVGNLEDSSGLELGAVILRCGPTA